MPTQAAEPLELTPPVDRTDQQIEFLDAWKQAVLATRRPTLFGVDKAEQVEPIQRRGALQPKVDLIKKRLPEMPQSQAALIICLVGFYNPAQGNDLQKKAGLLGLGALAGALHDAHRPIVARLFASYHGW